MHSAHTQRQIRFVAATATMAAIQSTRKPAANLFGILWHFNILCGKRDKYVVCPFCWLFRFWSKGDSVNIKLCIICLQYMHARICSHWCTFRLMLMSDQNQMRAFCNATISEATFIFDWWESRLPSQHARCRRTVSDQRAREAYSQIYLIHCLDSFDKYAHSGP